MSVIKSIGPKVRPILDVKYIFISAAQNAQCPCHVSRQCTERIRRLGQCFMDWATAVVGEGDTSQRATL